MVEQTLALPRLRPGAITVMAIACGIMVGNIYMCQPLLGEIAQGFGVSERLAGFVAVAAQVGYAVGILFVVPLADVAEPRRLLRILMAVTALGLLAAAGAPGVYALIAATLVVAAATVIPQMLIPMAASMVAPEHRGRAIGSLQTGLILGILLSRTVSGLVASASSTWRASYLLAGVLTLCLLVVLPSFMPEVDKARKRTGYFELLSSLLPMLKLGPVLVSVGLGFCIFAAFSAFWATLAFHLSTSAFGLGAAATGLFGLWGAPGAILAPFGGRLSDRFGPAIVNVGALCCAGLAFLIAGTAGATSILALVVAVNFLDFGLQSGQVANQARIFALGNDIRARLNTVYMVAVFSGGAIGSLLGTIAWSMAGWNGVCLLAGVLIVAAAVILMASSLVGTSPGQKH